MKLSGIVEHKFCKDQSFSLTTVHRKTSTNLHKNACGESTVATFLLTVDSIKNFLREFYTNFFRGMTLATVISEKIGVQVGCFRYSVSEKALFFRRRSLVEYFPKPAIHSVVF